MENKKALHLFAEVSETETTPSKGRLYQILPKTLASCLTSCHLCSPTLATHGARMVLNYLLFPENTDPLPPHLPLPEMPPSC